MSTKTRSTKAKPAAATKGALAAIGRNLAAIEVADKSNTTDSSPSTGSSAIKAGSPAPPKGKTASKSSAKSVIAIPMISGKGGAQKSAKAGTKGGRASETSKPTATSKRATKAPDKRSGRMSGLDAAAKVLADSGKPMTSQEIVQAMLGKGLWKTSGKTPHATIYAAIIREIANKGSGCRFRKTDRGHFTLAKGAR